MVKTCGMVISMVKMDMPPMTRRSPGLEEE
jgi:hypothetical protein